MSKTAKILLVGEKMVRGMNHEINKTFIDQLTREDLTTEEKNEIAEKAKDSLADGVQTEEYNSEFWYRYGKSEGRLMGMLEGVGCLAIGYAIGALLMRKR